MTGMAGRGWMSIRAARTLLEVTALTAGWLLGGTVGIGTLLFALGACAGLERGPSGAMTVTVKPGDTGTCDENIVMFFEQHPTS